MLAQQFDRPDRLLGGVALVQTGQDVVVDALQRTDHEQAAAGGDLLPHVGMFEHVLDLGGAVEGQRREALVQRADDRERMASAVEEVRVAKGDMAGAHRHQALDVAQNRVGLHDPDAPVVDRGNRAVAAAVHAAVAGLDVADQALLAAHGQSGVTFERRQQLARRQIKVPALKVDDTLL